MTSISALSSTSYQSPLQKLQDELQSEVNSGAVSSSDQSALSSALNDIDSALQGGQADASSGSTNTSPGDLKSKIDSLIANDGIGKVVDLGHTSFEPFFTLAGQFGFAEEARSRGIALVVLYMLTPDRTSVEAHRSLRSRLPQATLVPVHNEILGAAQYRDKYGLTGSATAVMRLPVLAPRLRKGQRFHVAQLIQGPEAQ